MPLKFKEDSKEWRKSVLLTTLGLALLSSVLRWRHVLPTGGWLGVLAGAAVIAALACLFPRWFRGYYRISMRLGFWSSQVVARVLLALLFLFLVTPLGLLFRALGKDALRLKRQKAGSYWVSTRESSPLDRMF